MKKLHWKSLLSLVLVLLLMASVAMPALAMEGTIIRVPREGPLTPTHPELYGQLKVQLACQNTSVTHSVADYELLAESFTASYPTKNEAGVYTSTVTVYPNKYIEKYNTTTGKTHSTQTASVSVVFEAYKDNDQWKWKPATDAVTTLKFDVLCTTTPVTPPPVVDPTPELPTFAELSNLIQVKVDCVTNNRHADYTFALIAGTYGISPVTGNATTGYTTTVSVFANGMTGQDGYVKAYNEKVASGHSLASGEYGQASLTLKYNSTTGKWYVVGAYTQPYTVTFKVSHTGSYTVTYKWSGEAPASAKLPVDNNLYSYGDRVTVAAAPKDVTWDGRYDGEWKWDPLNERWTWVGHDGYYWYGDRVDGVYGYWVFTGWERQVWVEGTRWERGYWKTETLKPGSTFTITEDTVIYGTWEFVTDNGTIVLSKYVSAPSGFRGDDEYTFEIYTSKNDRTPYKTVKLEAGETVYVSVPNGTYYVYEVDAEVAGYDLEVTVKGDLTYEGEKITIKGDSTYVRYTNTYTYEVDGPELNDEDHIAYITGYEDGTVRPEGNITREEVAMIFYRLLTEESRSKYYSTSNGFTDVKSTRWSNTAISTLVNAGVLTGYPDGSFKPAGNITRAEMATIISKFTEITGTRNNFTDISNHWASTYISAAARQGWVSGYPDGTFRPNNYITRAETMTMLNRVLNRNPGDVNDLLVGMRTFTDNQKTTKWYYLDVQEAANGHSYQRDQYGVEYWTALQ